MLIAYSAWATNRVFDAIAAMPEAEITRDMKSSHRSIHGTLVHMISAERIWLGRLLGRPEADVLTERDAPTLASLRTVWEQAGYDMAHYLGTVNDRSLQETLTAPSPKGGSFTHQISQVIAHIVDHSTYHRGQVITLMRQMGVVPPNTGMISFFRETGKPR